MGRALLGLPALFTFPGYQDHTEGRFGWRPDVCAGRELGVQQIFHVADFPTVKGHGGKDERCTNEFWRGTCSPGVAGERC